MNIRYASLSDPGQRHGENQDSVLTWEGNDAWLFVVADGVGGLRDGAEASKAAVRILSEEFTNLPPSDRGRYLVTSIEKASTAIGASRGGGSQPVSGSTIVALLMEPGRGALAHVGDSRAYRVRDGAITRLTDDHSLVMEQVRAGIITEAEAATSKNRHIVTRSLGVADTVTVDLREPVDLDPGDTFLLCSDGLHDVVNDDEIHGILASTPDEQEAVGKLVELANQRGGPDNISVVLVRILDGKHG